MISRKDFSKSEIKKGSENESGVSGRDSESLESGHGLEKERPDMYKREPFMTGNGYLFKRDTKRWLITRCDQ